ncbi:transcription termination/antitermination protein NusA [Iocasia frigidifontis]|uniref:Transcription termination/antitermination protein NusA n=1 Tax=Iocasia fonsfrigidae TaxID=2682810 RepID=A0A8A7K9C4_9FIRM|nr:transcription termination factor NusA [Iocasia fonsfrigidae]QTL98413.1 transcription termination/antitermination protein NusA [Iocasia fonsfrigidae]
MNIDFLHALDDIEKEKGISKETLLEALETALFSAYKKDYGTKENVRVDIKDKSGEVKVYTSLEVVEEADNENVEISLKEAKEIDPKYEIGDIVEREITPANFGRIATQTAKQVVMQRIREAERDVIYEEYKQKEGELITGTIQRFHRNNIFIDLGKIEALLPPSEQMPGESYEMGSRVKLYVVEVNADNKGPRILVSRTHPGLLKRLFEVEVPEIFDGIVEIMSVAREAGSRSKIAVLSAEANVDPVGACVGPKGMRVQAIVDQLNGEKIDIIEWSEEPAVLVANALNPAEVLEVIVDEEEKVAEVIVPDFQLSLAIGKAGQNARLAAKLTGWKVDIKNQTQYDQEKAAQTEKIEDPVSFDRDEDQVELSDINIEEAIIEENQDKEPEV